MISIVIRSKNQEKALEFALRNLNERYADDVDEIIVIDNQSTDNSKEITLSHSARFETIEKFSYGGSANFAASKASHSIIVIFSAHSYPVSHDFFKLIKQKFEQNPNLAGLRCLHNGNDYRNYINGITAKEDTNKSGLIFSGSAFARAVWEKHPFREDVATFEDKEWSKRVLAAGFDIDFVPSIFSYEIKRTRKSKLFRFKNDLVGNYQLWHQDITFAASTKGFLFNVARSISTLFQSLSIAVKLKNRPKKF